MELLQRAINFPEIDPMCMSSSLAYQKLVLVPSLRITTLWLSLAWRLLLLQTVSHQKLPHLLLRRGILLAWLPNQACFMALRRIVQSLMLDLQTDFHLMLGLKFHLQIQKLL
tara:strand:+ start:691 stop:1026 length:336 start_codon:yes stop_codon:yes gene_type:complete